MERVCGGCGDPYLTLKTRGPARCERCISRRRARPKHTPAPVIAPTGELVCRFCLEVYAPSSSTDSQPRLYCSPDCGWVGRVDVASKAAQDRFGVQEWWRRLMAVNHHNSAQDDALIKRWPEGWVDSLPTHDEYEATVDAMRSEMGIPRVHGYPDPAELPPIIYPDRPKNSP
jgi:hypothetical protein